MSEPAVPAKAAPQALAPTATEEPRKLDDVLLAMDVVDTLRHRERVVDMELDAAAREAQLIQRLKEIYDAQGISVPDRILKDGVKALEEQRFAYKPPADSFSVRLARLYVSRKHWLPGALTLTGGVLALLVGWQVLWAMPQAAEWRKLPAELVQLNTDGQALAVDPAVDAQVEAIFHAGERAVANNNHGEARRQLKALRDINEQLADEFEVRIVYGDGQDTGFYRVPPGQPLGRNYYLVVEAVAPGGRVLKVPVVNEETQKPERVTKWAQRVTQDVFDKVAEDKAPDQIIQNDVLGYKARGKLVPDFTVPVPGGAITSW
jgi:hypothetical protein